MATETTLLTRIGLKVDTLANWNNSSLILKKGEVAFATVAAAAGSNLTEPVVMMKIGDGEHTFANLEFNFYAKASDVLEAAKSETKLKAFVNSVIADAGIASNETVTQLGKDVNAIELDIATLKGDVNTAGSIAQKIKAAIDGINTADTAVTGQYVSSVYQSNGKVVVEREALPTYTLASGSDNGTVAFNGDDIAVTGLKSAAYTDAEDYEVAGAAAAVEGKLNTYKTSNDVAVLAAKTQADKGVENAAEALRVANTKVTMTDVEGKNYATKTEAEAYANAKDAAIAEAKKAGTDAANALNAYKATNDAALELKVDTATYAEDKADLEASIKANADAITLLTDGADPDKVDSVKDLIDYVDKHGAEVTGMKEDIEAAQDAADKVADDLAVEILRAKAAEEANAANITKFIEGNATVAEATHAVNADNATNAADAAKLGGVAAADYATKTYADTKASAAQASAEAYADGLAKNYATAEQGALAATAVQPAALNDYYTKAQADAEFMNSAETGSAIDAKITALNLAATYEPKGAQAKAEAYADSLAANYATAAQGAKADSALQEIKAGTGLKITGDKNDTVDIDTAVVFVFDCGGASEHTVQA